MNSLTLCQRRRWKIGLVVFATAFITFFARALETQSHNPILSDLQAVTIVEKLRPHFAHSQRALEQQVAMGRIPPMVVVTMALRARRMDVYARDFLARHPDGEIVNLGCGLDTRFHRIDDGCVTVYDLDLSAMIELKRTLLDGGERCRFIAASVLDFAWMERLDASMPPFTQAWKTVARWSSGRKASVFWRLELL